MVVSRRCNSTCFVLKRYRSTNNLSLVHEEVLNLPHRPTSADNISVQRCWKTVSLLLLLFCLPTSTNRLNVGKTLSGLSFLCTVFYSLCALIYFIPSQHNRDFLSFSLCIWQIRALKLNNLKEYSVNFCVKKTFTHREPWL